jgi:sugar lactone lactonase YvrE
MLTIVVVVAAGIACSPGQLPEDAAEVPAGSEVSLAVVASSDRQWTGLTVTRDGRLFVNFPRWSPEVPVSVAEVVDGAVRPWPDEEWNDWSPETGDPAARFVCVQSVVADGAGSLWVLDPGNPGFAGVVEGAAKLLRFDVASGELLRAYHYGEPVIREQSYLNDVRVDLEAGFAYITDSGDGAIVVTELDSGASRRLLDDHPSTEAEDVVLTIGGMPWRRPDGPPPQVHADGIALSPDRRHLYWHALTGYTLYRIDTAALQDPELAPEGLAERVETVATTSAVDGMIFGPDGKLYLSALEHDAIERFDPATGSVELVVRDERIRWPDTFTVDPEGRILFTTAQIHLGANPETPYEVLRILQ